jgi:hypothetical protein
MDGAAAHHFIYKDTSVKCRSIPPYIPASMCWNLHIRGRPSLGNMRVHRVGCNACRYSVRYPLTESVSIFATAYILPNVYPLFAVFGT